MSTLEAAEGRVWALPGHLRRTIQVSCYGDLTSQFRQANIPVLKACLDASSFWNEVCILDRLIYKNTYQHRGAHLMRYMKEMRRVLTLLRELHLEGLMDDLYCMLQRGGVVPKAAASATGGGGATGRAAAAAAGTTRKGKVTTEDGNIGTGGGGGSGGRTSYRLPCREAAAAILKQIIVGCALVMGLQAPLQRAAAHLAAQVALTFFVPMCTVGCAVLARIKVLSLQLLVDYVRAYNAIADLLPLLPASTAVSPEGGDAALLLQPALAAALQPPTGKASTAVVTESMASEPRVLPGTSRAATAMQQKQQQAQVHQQEEIRSRSLKQMLERGNMPSDDLLQPATAIRKNNSAAEGLTAAMQPAAASAAPATGPVSQRLPAAEWPQRQVAPIPLPQMVRCRWDEHVHSAYLEPVLSGGPDQPEPTWQERAAKAAERYGYMIAVQCDPQVAVADLDTVGPVVPLSSEANRLTHSVRSARPRTGFARTAGGSATAATANVVAAPPSAAESNMGVRISRRSFFDLMASKRPTGLSAVQPVASGKRVHAAQAMTHLQVSDDRVAKRQKGPNGAAVAMVANVNVDGATAVTEPVAARSGGSLTTAAVAAIATTVITPAATVTAAPLPQPAGAGPSVPDSHVVSYTTRHGFVLGLGNTKSSSGGNNGGGHGGPVQPTSATGPSYEPRCSVVSDKAEDQSVDWLKDGATASGDAPAGALPAAVPIVAALPRLASTTPAPSPAPVTRGSMARPSRSGAKPAFLAVPPSNLSSRAGTAGSTAGGGSGVMVPGAAAAVVPQPNPGDHDGGRLALTHGSVSADGVAATKDDPLLGIILQGRVGDRGRGRGVSGGGGSSCTRPGLLSAGKASRASSGAAAAAAGGGSGGSLAATLDLLLEGLVAAPGEGAAGGMHPGGLAGNAGGCGLGGDTASRGGTLAPGRGSGGARGRSGGQTSKWR
ncbi:hypothetical protein VaNZ11_015739, partial [Volvox africanus]